MSDAGEGISRLRISLEAQSWRSPGTPIDGTKVAAHRLILHFLNYDNRSLTFAMFHRGGLHVQAYVGGYPGQHRFGLRHIGSGAAFQSGDQAAHSPKPAGGAADSQARQIRSNRQA